MIWRLLLSRQLFRNKTQDKSIEKIMLRNNSHVQIIGLLIPVKKSFKTRKDVIIVNSEMFEKCFVLNF